jgi:hypothetical protein
MKYACTIVKIGYHTTFAFKTTDEAIEFYRLVSASMPVESHYGALPDGRKDVRYIRADNETLELEQILLKNIELNFTEKELKEQAEANDDVDGVVEIISVTDAPKEIGCDEIF